MSLLICIRNIKDGDRELCLYKSRGEYSIRYENRKQNTTLKRGITDDGYANYLFDMFAKDLHMEENSIENKDTYEKDRKSIRKIIKTKYNKTFGEVDEDKINFRQLLDDLYSLRESINSIESKKSTWTNQNNANKKVNQLIDYIEDRFKQN